MAYNYRWTITNLEGYQEHPQSGLADVVATAQYELEIRDLEDHSIHYLRGKVELDLPDPASFTDFLELDSADVLQWVWDKIGGREAAEKQILDELNDMRAPRTQKINTMNIPWLQSCCADGQNVQAQSVFSGPPPF
jgi:hypothetical protein